MHVLDKDLFYEKLSRKGYRGVGDLAARLGVHRNTIQHYLCGHGVFPEKLELVFAALDMDPRQAIKKQFLQIEKENSSIHELVDALHEHFPKISLVLFGSRARSLAQKYSDWDIGVYSKEGISRQDFLKMKILKSEWEEKSPYFVDLVNLNRADVHFLHEISSDWKFMAGRSQDWLDLQRKVFS